jgi:hypothetical protein
MANFSIFGDEFFNLGIMVLPLAKYASFPYPDSRPKILPD